MLSTISRRIQHSDERGQILVLFAGGLMAILLIAALAFDVGMMLVERRDQQNAADAAALAGARYVMTDSDAARSAANRIAQLNGFDDADPSETVTVHIPPIHGRYVGLPGFIEVQIESTRPSIFGGVIGKAVWPVGAFAVATDSQDLHFAFSMLALDPTACKAIQVSGTGEINGVGTIQSNSSGEDCTGDPVSFSRTGGSTINVGEDVYCRAFGEIQDEGSGSMDCTPDPNSFALPDPLRNLEAPAQPGLAAEMIYVGAEPPPADQPDDCPGSDDAPPSETAPATCKLAQIGAYFDMEWVLYPGLYPGGLEVTNGTTAYLMPGVYWIGGGGIRVATGGSIFTVGAEADATPNVADATWGGGILIYNSKLDTAAAGPINQNGDSAYMKLKPLNVSTSDPNHIYNNIVIFQDRTVTETVTLNGASSVTEVEGLIYVPSGEVILNGNGGTLTIGQIIAGTYKINGGGGTINITDDDLFEAIITAAGLVD